MKVSRSLQLLYTTKILILTGNNNRKKESKKGRTVGAVVRIRSYVLTRDHSPLCGIAGDVIGID